MMNIKHTAEIDFNGQKALLETLTTEIKTNKSVARTEVTLFRNKRDEVSVMVFFTKLNKKQYNQFWDTYTSAGFRVEQAGDCVIVNVGKKPYKSVWA